MMWRGYFTRLEYIILQTIKYISRSALILQQNFIFKVFFFNKLLNTLFTNNSRVLKKPFLFYELFNFYYPLYYKVKLDISAAEKKLDFFKIYMHITV